MTMLFAKCTVTGNLIETGVECDDDSLALMERSKVAVWCDKCRRHHIMRVGELYCAAEEPVAA